MQTKYGKKNQIKIITTAVLALMLSVMISGCSNGSKKQVQATNEPAATPADSPVPIATIQPSPKVTQTPSASPSVSTQPSTAQRPNATQTPKPAIEQASAQNAAVTPKPSASSNTSAQAEAKNATGDLVIPVSEITDKAKFYSVAVEGTKMEVIAVKAPDGSIRTAFNTCQVCYDSGKGYYKQQGNVLVCQNCGNRFTMDRVEVESGGCNPVPIFGNNKIVTDKTITIPYDFLKESKDVFRYWKDTN